MKYLLLMHNNPEFIRSLPAETMDAIGKGHGAFIETVRGPVTLSTDARDELLDKVGRFENGKPVMRAFEKAGTALPSSFITELPPA